MLSKIARNVSLQTGAAIKSLANDKPSQRLLIFFSSLMAGLLSGVIGKELAARFGLANRVSNRLEAGEAAASANTLRVPVESKTLCKFEDTVPRNTVETGISPSLLHQRQQNALLAFFSVFFLCFYVWTAGTNGVNLITRETSEYFTRTLWDEIRPEVSKEPYGFYNLMADAFLQGESSLPVIPRPELMNLENPYDPGANWNFRLHDASLYQGRYYLYFGPVPALVLFIPFRLLGIGSISQLFACALFSFGAYLCAAVTLLVLVRRLIPNLSHGMLAIALFVLGMCNVMPFVLRRPIVYEVALTSGAFFIMLGILCFVQGWRKNPSTVSLVALSISWGLAWGCRPIHLFGGFVLFGIWVALMVSNKPRRLKDALIPGLALSVPFVFCLAAYAVYNWARFGSLGEFGFSYQLSNIYYPKETFWRLGNLLTGLYLDTLSPFNWNKEFPFVSLGFNLPWAPPPGYPNVETQAGFLVTAPITGGVFLAWVLVLNRKIDASVRFTTAVMTAYGLGILCFSRFYGPFTSMRYQLDYSLPILITALLVWLYLDSKILNETGKSIYRSITIQLIVFGLFVHFALGLAGCYDLFRAAHPNGFWFLRWN
jgi:hypothetical protein